MGKRWHLRQEMLLVTKNLDQRWANAASSRIVRITNDFLDKPEFEDRVSLLLWKTYFQGEIDLDRLINLQLEKREVFLPRTDKINGMTFWKIDKGWEERLEKGPSGILQPKETSGVEFDYTFGSSAMILVPALGYDRDGVRLPRGGNYYARLFSRTGMAQCIKVGVCWSLQVLDKVPTDGSSATMDYIIHENGIIKTGVTFEDEWEDE